MTRIAIACRLCPLLVAALGVAAAAAAQPAPAAPARDAVKPAATGTAVISGVAVADGADAQPLRRTRVSVSTNDRTVSQTAITDDAGRFALTNLPAGRYLLSAHKPGFVAYSHGATRPNRPGTAIVLAEGQRMTGLALRLSRGAVITGQLADQNGDPLPGVTVSAMRHVFANAGQRQLVPQGSGQTDDRGVFRIWGLAGGEYVIAANPTISIGARTDLDIVQVTDADIKRARSEIARGGGPAGAAAGNEGAPPPARTVGYAAVYYPGTFVASQASPVKIANGEERSGVDFRLRMVATSKVEGTVAVPDGMSPRGHLLQMISGSSSGFFLDGMKRATTTADGAFTFVNVTPGVYTIIGRGMAGPPGTPLTRDSVPTHYAIGEVAVEGDDVSGVSLQMLAGLTVSGRLVFEGTGALPDPSRFRVGLAPPQTPGVTAITIGVSFTAADSSGAFSIAGVVPGRYRLTGGLVTPQADQTWQVKAATIDGRDALDADVDIQSPPRDVVITLTDRIGEVSGMVEDASGRPAPEYHVILFPPDRAQWTPASRRLRSVRPSNDGRYTFTGLLPGDYLIAAVPDIEPGEWYDPAILEPLIKRAVSFTLADGEKKTQNIPTGGRVP